MNEDEKCCFFARPHVGAAIIGVGSLVVFGMIALTSGVLLGLEFKQMERTSSDDNHDLENVLGTKFKYISITAMLGAILIVSALATFFSALLIVGVLKNLSGLVLSFFCFGILTTILMLLGCLLLLIHNFWYISIILFFVTVFYMFCLLVVHKFYENIVTGTYPTFNREDSMEEELLNEDGTRTRMT